MRVSSAFLGTVLLFAAPACGAIWGFEDGTLASELNEGGASSGGTSGSSGSSGDLVDGSSSGELPPDTETPVPDDCATKSLEPGALYVDQATGDDSGTCGADQTPCKTIGRALQLADSTRSGIYVGLGKYVESITVDQRLFGRGFFLEGRWQRTTEGAWQPFCVPGDVRAANLVGLGDQPATIRAAVELPDEDAGAPAADAGADATPDAAASDGGAAVDLRISSLTLNARDGAAQSVSAYGIFARGIRLHLYSVGIVAGRGGNGANADAPRAGESTAGCGSGDPGRAGGPGAGGVCTADGWSANSEPAPVAATDGETGGCGGGGLGGVSKCLGGHGGVAGLTGGTGGGSFAIYAWDAAIKFEDDNSILSTVGGGRGGNGSAGLAGLPGQQPATFGCTGEAGQSGGTGGTGSPGAGGASYCIVSGGESGVVGAAMTCTPGPGGIAGEDPDGLRAASGATFEP